MQVEECSEKLLEMLLERLDEKRSGVAIDAGVGTFAFYCELFARLGFRSAAVEPLPSQKLRDVCSEKGITLFENCLSDRDGTQTLYLGNFCGDNNSLDYSSLLSDWWGASRGWHFFRRRKQVPTLSLSGLLSRLKAQEITCLKLDIEGAELTVLSQLPELTGTLMPKIIMFEYGGGDLKKSGKGAWAPKFFAQTLRCLDLLQQCGYATTIRIESSPLVEKIFDIGSYRAELDEIFPAQACYGNLISLHGNFIHLEPEIKRICSSYRSP